MKTATALVLCLTLLPTVVLGQKTVTKGFGDVVFAKSDNSEDGGSFAIGQYDHFIMSELSDRVTFLGETVFEFDGGWILDVERVWVRYSFSQYFQVTAGKMHTALGYWNRAYHHGSLLHTSIMRPNFLFFEDEGGILPIHTTGLLLSGQNIGQLNFNYDVMVGNGVGSEPTGDNDKAKAISGYFHIKPIRGLDVGVSFYLDKISAGVLKSDEETPLPNKIKNSLLGVSLAYYKNDVEFISEIVRVKNEDDVTGVSGSTTGFYALASYSFDSWMPYVKFDLMSFEDTEPLFLGQVTKVFAGGVRYNLNYLTALKLELRVAEIANDTEIQVASQFSFSF